MNTLAEQGARAPVHPLSALSLVLADWLATGLNIASAMEAYWAVTSACTVLAAGAVFSIEHLLMHVPPRKALLRSAATTPLILLPFPFAGSAVGVALLAWAFYFWLQRPRD